MTNKSIFFFIAWVAIVSLRPIDSTAQIVGSDDLWFKDFTLHNKPPKYLLSRKSAVFLRVPRSEDNPNVRSDWKKLAGEVHEYLLQMRVDAIGYYHVNDLFSGSDPIEAFSKTMIQRNLKYIILITQTRNENRGEPDHFEVIVTPYNESSSFIDQNANAWKIEGIGLKDVMRKMFNEVYRSELELENYLIMDIPEFFTDVKIIKGRRIETYAMDLKVEKLIVPKFRKIVPTDSTKLGSSAFDQIKVYNREVDKKNQRLEEIMKTYPLAYEISEDFSDQEVYNKGGQFVLLSLNSTGETIRELLDYKTQPGETVFASIKSINMGSTVLRLPKEAVVHKFYVKHVYTKDVYTGLKWDADLTWEEALQNFIFNMKDVLNLK